MPLVDLKEIAPVQVAQYVNANKLGKEPAFAWWVPFTLRKSDQIISAVKNKCRVNRKFGFEIPQNKADAIRIDEQNGNTLWRDATMKEMESMSPAFQILEDDEKISGDYRRVTFHLIYDIKLDFTRKARLVADGHKLPTPSSNTFAGVVSRESVRIAFTYAALNGLTVSSCDIKNAYLQSPTSGKYYTILNSNFGDSFVGKKALVVRACYGLKEAAADFRNHLRDCMTHLGYKPTHGDNDLWIRPSTEVNDQFHEMILLYVDDCLAIHNENKPVLQEIGKYFKLKDGSLGPPKIYLGGKVSKIQLPNGIWAYTFSPTQYVKEAVANVERYLKQMHYKFSSKLQSIPLQTNYHPELDSTPELNEKESKYFQSLIGILRWIVELGRIDINFETSIMSSHVMLPRVGHMMQVINIFRYLKHHSNARLVFDPTYPNINYDAFPINEWSNYYDAQAEEMPQDMPTPMGKEMLIVAYVDADFAGDRLRRKSRTGFVIFLNQAPIYWYYK